MKNFGEIPMTTEKSGLLHVVKEIQMKKGEPKNDQILTTDFVTDVVSLLKSVRNFSSELLERKKEETNLSEQL